MISASRVFDLDIHELWELISEPGALEKYHPFCIKNDVLVWSENERKDTICYANGKVFTRKFTDWVNCHSFKLNISNGHHDASVEWNFEKINDKSKLTIIIFPKFMPKNTVLRSIGSMIVRYNLRLYLNKIMCGIEYYIKFNKKVTINQFGSHRWFS